MFTFVMMKKKYAVGSLFFGLLVLFAILLQSIHSIHHLEEALVEKKCFHDSEKNNAEITHSHNTLDNCFVCEFTFETAIKTTFFSLEFKKLVVSNPYTYFHSKEITQFFKGSLFALRAPPSFIV